jgi:hypothetical protein
MFPPRTGFNVSVAALTAMVSVSEAPAFVLDDAEHPVNPASATGRNARHNRALPHCIFLMCIMAPSRTLHRELPIEQSADVLS